MALSTKARNRFIAAMARRPEAVEILNAIDDGVIPIDANLTGYVAGSGGAVSALSASDTILSGMQKLDGNKPNYVEATFSATFTNSIGALTVVVRKIGKEVMLEIPTGSATLSAAVIASGATDVPAAYRPAVNITIPVLVVDATVRKIGQAVISSAGQITISVLGSNFGAGVGGFDRCSLVYSASSAA